MGWLEELAERRAADAARFDAERAAMFPDQAAVDAAVAGFEAGEWPVTGPGFELIVSPGSVQLRTRMAWELDAVAFDAVAETEGGAGWEQPPLWAEPRPKGTKRAVTEWSPGSRANMVKVIASLDFKEWLAKPGGALGMVTLTLPGMWEVAAPTGKAFKALLRAWRMRLVRAGVDPTSIWKLEFQLRGAPHLHDLMRCPTWVGGELFEVWLSKAWADVVLNSLKGEQREEWIRSGEYARHRAAGTAVDFDRRDVRDPRRAAVYFLKHSSKSEDDKEYQHRVPAAWRQAGAGPGRFWGVWGLRPAKRAVVLDGSAWHRARRVLRHVRRARAWEVAASRARHAVGSVVEVRCPKVRGLGARGGGTVVVNDGPALARVLAMAL
ncbi:MAG: hypothetical protein LBK95_11890 [Bifidobacteriaceae bacterium]|jgi:hypothetical protein|nr:hypothetical protein [Bifidobacteriaceae bacterium]